MKRLVAVVLVVTMLCGGVCAAMGEEKQKTSDQFISMLKALKLVYDINPDKFGTEKIMYTYIFYETYMQMSLFEMVQNASNVEYIDPSMMDMTKDIAKGNVGMLTEPREAFEKWLEGEITDRECIDTLMTFAGIMISSVDKVNGN